MSASGYAHANTAARGCPETAGGRALASWRFWQMVSGAQDVSGERVGVIVTIGESRVENAVWTANFAQAEGYGVEAAEDLTGE